MSIPTRKTTAARPTPKPQPRSGPRLVPFIEARMSAETPRPWRFTDLAREQIQKLGLAEETVKDFVVTAPIRNVTAKGGINHYSQGYLILVDGNGQCVISIIKREPPVTIPADHSEGGSGGAESRADTEQNCPGYTPAAASQPRAKSGGPGRKMPSTAKELNALLRQKGFHVELGNYGHFIATHPDHSMGITFPGTPSDTRAYRNTVAQIKRSTGIDVTQTED